MLLRQALTSHCVYGMKSSVNLILNALQRYCGDERVCGSLARSVLRPPHTVLCCLRQRQHHFTLFRFFLRFFSAIQSATASSCVCVSLYCVWLCLPSNVRSMLQHQNKVVTQSGRAHAPHSTIVVNAAVYDDRF